MFVTMLSGVKKQISGALWMERPKPIARLRFIPGNPSRLYRNRGDGTFEDVTVASGVYNENGKSLGVALLDYNDDEAFFEIKKLGVEKKLDIVIATQKGDVGLNNKTFDHLIITTPTGGNIEKFNQQKGRVERDYDEILVKKFGKKKTPTVDYLWDLKHDSLRSKGRKIMNNYANVNILQTKGKKK